MLRHPVLAHGHTVWHALPLRCGTIARHISAPVCGRYPVWQISRPCTPLLSGACSGHNCVGNLPCTTTAQDPHQLFEPNGTVETTKIVTDRNIGHSRRFGVVEMPDSRAGQSAIDALNGTPWARRTLRSMQREFGNLAVSTPASLGTSQISVAVLGEQ